jgi:nucleotide-binding universal stress UspA family protein
MATTIIVSYDGTDNDRDALALGKVLGQAGAKVALAYVRHAQEEKSSRERLAERDAQALLDAGASALDGAGASTHVVMSGSTPNGLRELAEKIGADAIVFGSEYRTARGHVDPQASARRLLDGGPIAVALAPAGFAEAGEFQLSSIGAAGEDGDPCVLETAESISAKLGGEIAQRATANVDLMIVGSKPGTVNGRVRISAAAEYLIELSRCPVLVLPRGVAVEL